MNPQLRSHFRGHFAAIEPQLHSVLFESFVELLPGLLGLNHRCIHTGIIFRCLSLPVSVKSAQPQLFQILLQDFERFRQDAGRESGSRNVSREKNCRGDAGV
jgi:hypothetical protein